MKKKLLSCLVLALVFTAVVAFLKIRMHVFRLNLANKALTEMWVGQSFDVLDQVLENNGEKIRDVSRIIATYPDALSKKGEAEYYWLDNGLVASVHQSNSVVMNFSLKPFKPD